jgi:hypothetical protein
MNTTQINPKKLARTAGFLYFLLIPLGIFGILYIPANFVVMNDAVATITNINNDTFSFRLSIALAMLTQLVNIAVVLTLYKLLKVVDRNIALLMVLFSILAMPIAMLNELNHIAVLLLLEGTQYLSAFTSQQIEAMVMGFLALHEHGIHIAGIFWGLWLFPMGLLVYKSNFIPKIIGVLLMIGCFGYIADFIFYLLFPTSGILVSGYTFWGEIAILFWLLVKGVDVDVWNRVALGEGR